MTMRKAVSFGVHNAPSSPPNKTTKNKMRKRVSFGECSSTVVNHTAEELEALWYSQSELKTIKKEEFQLAMDSSDKDSSNKSCCKDTVVGEEEVCLRGLEPYADGMERFKNHNHAFVKNVLNLQNELREMNLYDPKGLQAFASAHSKQDCRDARKRGKEDATEVGANPGKLLLSSRAA